MIIAEQKLFDLSFLEQIDAENFVIKVIVMYLHDTNNDFVDIENAMDKENIDAVCKTAHKLKSSTGMLQAHKLYAVLEQIELISKDENGNELSGLVQTARNEFDVLKKALEIHLDSIKRAA